MLLFTLLAGCLPSGIHIDDTGRTACTDIAMASVSVTVVGEDGAPIPEATVTYSLDGVDHGACEAWPGGGWVCGIEVAGHIVVTATALGYSTESGAVDIVMDAEGCHVVGQSLTLTLSALDCQDDAVTSVRATLRGSSGERLDNAWVSWRPADVDGPSDGCTPSDLEWECGIEVSGPLEIQGSADGHTTATALVDVPVSEDGCHVVTQSVDLVIEWLPD